MKELAKKVRKVSKETRVTAIICIVSVLVLIIANCIGLCCLQHSIQDSYSKLSNDLDDYMIATEPDVLESDFPHKKLGKFALSWYSPKELGKTKPEELRTSTGKVPVSGRTIAVDPKVIPYGSIIYIQNYGYFIADDCGGAIKGNRIDIFTASHKEAIQNGKRIANVYLLK